MPAKPLILAALVAFVFVPAVAEEAQAPFRIKTKRDDDRVVVQELRKAGQAPVTVIVVRSPFGISEATITRTAPQWPEPMLVRLHLNGLENFQISNGKTTLHAAVGSTPDTFTLREWVDDTETEPLTAKSPLWMELHLRDAEGKLAPRGPLKAGAIEIRLPPAFLAGSGESLTLHWIDFYRN